jgi:hypothetical protein
VTTTLPVVAPVGTVVVIEFPFQLETVAVVPLKVTVLDPWEVPKFDPLIVTDAPTAPVVRDKLVMLGVTVNAEPLLATPPTVTTTFPEVAPFGTVVPIEFAPQLETVVVVPLNATELVP